MDIYNTIESMDVHGARPLGVNWYRLLSVYSDLGKKSIATEKVSDIGTELQTFRADVETAMRGINAKLGDLIHASTTALSGNDLTKLKDDIVSGLRDHVQSSGATCTAPVVCDGKSVVFTDEVTQLLKRLVEQKTSSALKQMEDMARDIAEIKTWGDTGISGTETDTRVLGRRHQELKDALDQGFKRADDRSTPGTEAFSNRLEPLSEAVAGKLFAEDAPLTQSFIRNLEAASKAVVEKISAEDGPRAATSALKQMKDMARDIAEIKTWGDTGISGTETDTRVLQGRHQELKDALEQGFKRADDRSTPGTDAFNTNLEHLSQAVAQKLFAEGAPLTESFIRNLEAVSKTVVEKISAEDGPLAEAFVHNQEAFSKRVIERLLAGDGPLTEVFNSYIEALSTALVQKLFAADAPFAEALGEKLSAEDGPFAALPRTFVDRVFAEDGPYKLAFITNLEALSNAVVARIFAEDGPLIAHLSRREGLSLAESKKLADEAVHGVWKADGPGTKGVTQAMKSLLDEPIANISTILELVAMPDGFNTRLYTKRVDEVRRLFVTKDSALDVEPGSENSSSTISFFSIFVQEYTFGTYTKSDDLTREHLLDSVLERLGTEAYFKMDGAISSFLTDLLEKIENDISKLQLLHVFFKEKDL